jgi:hypothetical protein
MENAEFGFTRHERAVRKLQQDLQTAFARAQARARNAPSTAQWDLLISPDQNLLGGFLDRWEREDSLRAAFIVESRRLVASAFAELTATENRKNGAQG